jgi:methyltransferase
MTLPFVAFAALLLGTGAMRLVELWVSVRRIRARPDDLVGEPALFPLMALLHTLLVFAPLAEVWWLQRPFLPWAAALSVEMLVAATVLRVWTLRTIGWAWNVRVVKPPAEAVVTTGPYAWVRHPNYLAVIVEIAALPLFHGAWWSLLGLSLLNAAVLAVRIPTEERVLAEIPGWRDAMADRARFLPGVF